MAKGSSFEREVCRRLSLWWTDGADDDVFWRTSNSGGRATARHRKGKRTQGHHGDVAAVDGRGEALTKLLIIELKRGYNHLSLQDLLDVPVGKKGGNAGENWTDWLTKAQRDHEAAGSRSWLMIVRRDRREPLVIAPDRLVLDLVGREAESDGDPAWSIRILCRRWRGYIWAFLLKDFLAQIRPSATIRLLAAAHDLETEKRFVALRGPLEDLVVTGHSLPRSVEQVQSPVVVGRCC